jgi:glycosyltransferase involved in cell wall biosynthesis
MKILLAGRHRYPAGGRVAMGLRPNPRATGGSCVVHDLLAKGMAELNGHVVMYHLEKGMEEDLPDGAIPVTGSLPVADIVHHSNSLFVGESEVVRHAETRGIPWITTCHLHPKTMSGTPGDNWVFVSRPCAAAQGSSRYVTNGVDPGQFIFSEARGTYLLFIGNLRDAYGKGLDLALAISRRVGFPLVVAATSVDAAPIQECVVQCEAAGARFVGDIRGMAKAELLAGAAALLFPSRLNEACPLVLLEALMSGTPIICSDQPVCREIGTPDVGFVCRDFAEYVEAVNGISRISRRTCRETALEKYHYHRMAREYLREYERELSHSRT